MTAAINPALAKQRVAEHADTPVSRGNTVLKPSKIQKIVARFAGKSRDSSAIDQEIKALEAAYRERGSCWRRSSSSTSTRSIA